MKKINGKRKGLRGQKRSISSKRGQIGNTGYWLTAYQLDWLPPLNYKSRVGEYLTEILIHIAFKLQ